MDVFIKILGYIAATLTTASFVPQLISVIKTRSTKDISLVMYIAFVIGVICWSVYGGMIQDYPVLIANVISCLFAGTILIFKIINTVSGKDKADKLKTKKD
jgi:MtN3 and saliva related transmembrane protein